MQHTSLPTNAPERATGEDFSFGERLALLRLALGEGDPLAAPEPLAPTGETEAARAADALAAAFHAAPAARRAAYLLRALDDAIVALDLSAQLADEFSLTPGQPLIPQPTQNPAELDEPDDPLFDAYLAFAASQPTWQALYQYRNALAERLRLAARELPTAVAASPAATAPTADAAGALADTAVDE